MVEFLLETFCQFLVYRGIIKWSINRWKIWENLSSMANISKKLYLILLLKLLHFVKYILVIINAVMQQFQHFILYIKIIEMLISRKINKPLCIYKKILLVIKSADILSLSLWLLSLLFNCKTCHLHWSWCHLHDWEYARTDIFVLSNPL